MKKILPARTRIPVCGAYGWLYPNLSTINFLGPSFFRNKFPFPKKGTTPRRIWYTKNIQNQFWDHGGKHLWIKFQWPRWSCLSLCKSPTNSAPRNSTLFFGCNPSVAEYFSMVAPASNFNCGISWSISCWSGVLPPTSQDQLLGCAWQIVTDREKPPKHKHVFVYSNLGLSENGRDSQWHKTKPSGQAENE